MFKRLVSNLPYSPALIGQVGFYARRLRQEEVTRRLGLVFTVLAVVVQSFAIFSPPEVLASASPNNVIFEGVRSKADLLRVYDANSDSNGNRDIQQIFTTFGISRADLLRVKESKINSRNFNGGIWSVGRTSYASGTNQEQEYAISDSNSVFARKLASFDRSSYTKQNGSTYDALTGTRADGSWFAVMFDCGNLAYTRPPANPVQQPVSSSTPAAYKASKTVANTTRRIDNANGSTAQPGDRLLYNLTVTNMGNEAGQYGIRDNVADVLEYADIIDAGGGRIEKDGAGKTTGFISWPMQPIAGGAVATRSLTVQVKDTIPATPQNAGNPESYNCIMTNSFGSSTNVKVDCPPGKVVESTIKELPSTGVGENIIFSGLLLIVVTYFYARSRQLGKEVRLVRREFATSTL